MSSVPKHFLTPEEYLLRERAADFRSEYYKGEMFAMAGASWEHTLIKDNIARAAGNQLANGSCRVVTSDLRVKIDATGLYTYPDLVIVCDTPKFEDKTFDTLLNPRVLIEVLSDSTEKYDRGVKSSQYRTLTSLEEYVLVAQDRPAVERYVRHNDSWLLTAFEGIESVFTFVSVPVAIPLAEIYRDVTFPEPTLPKPDPQRIRRR